jgi:cbb3-type cytochrome oxidase subunit 3
VTNFDRDRFDALLKLAEFKRTVREGRRQFEWRFTATAFVALAGLSVFPEKANAWGITAVILVLCALHTFWIFWNQSRAEQERVEMYNYKDEAEAMLFGKSRYQPSVRLPFYKQPACRFQVGTAYLIALFSIAVRQHWIIG